LHNNPNGDAAFVKPSGFQLVTPDANAIAAAIESCKKPIEEKTLSGCLKLAHDEYVKLGGTDKVAKGTRPSI
jgi:hypothetical protein